MTHSYTCGLGTGVPRRTRMARAVAFASAALFAGTAAAQDTESSGGRYSLALEEVVVTAQKREENFMTVPVTVNASPLTDCHHSFNSLSSPLPLLHSLPH